MKHCFSVCAYGDSPYLESCLKSLKAQSVQSDIIICTSTPSEYINDLAGKYEIPVYVRTGESGIAHDWNFAYEKADADLVTIAHQDDMYRHIYTEELFKAKNDYPDMSVFMSSSVTVKGDKIIEYGKVEIIKKLLRVPLRFGSKKAALRFGNPVICPSCTYDKKLCGNAPFDAKYSFVLDWDALWKLSEKEGRFICVETPLVMYRVHDGAATAEAIKSNVRQREESEMFDRTLPEPIAKIVKELYKKSYEAYME